MRSGTRVRRNGAFGARAQGLTYIRLEKTHFDTYPKRFFDTCRVRIHARLRCVSKRFPTGTPLRGTQKRPLSPRNSSDSKETPKEGFGDSGKVAQK